MNTNTNTARIIDTGLAGYGTFDLATFEQFEIIENRFISAPEIAESQMKARMMNVGGAISRNDGSYHNIIKDVEAFIRREMTGDEFRVSCVMMGRAKPNRV